MQRGDLVATVGRLLTTSSHDAPFHKLVLDFVLGHTYSGSHMLKRDTLDIMETMKCRHYTESYHAQGIAFAPLAANSFGQLGPEFLRFLWALADFSARNYIPVPLPVLPVLSNAEPDSGRDSPQVIRFKRLRGRTFVQARLHILSAIYEAITFRVYGRTFPLQGDSNYWAQIRDISWHGPPPLSQSSDAVSQPSMPSPDANALSSARPCIQDHCFSFAQLVAGLPPPMPPFGLGLTSTLPSAPISPSPTPCPPTAGVGDCSPVDRASVLSPGLSPVLVGLRVTPPLPTPSSSPASLSPSF